MAPKALCLLPLLAPFTFAWGSTHDLYIRDAIPEPDPYAYEQALAARALVARKVYAAKARRAANGRVVLSRQVSPRSANAVADPEIHAFQQYDAGLFRRDGSVIPRDPIAYPGAAAIASDPEAWFEGGELYARSHSHDLDSDNDEEDEEPQRQKTSKGDRKNRKQSSRQGQREDSEEDDVDGTTAKGEKEEESGRKGSAKTWFSWFRW
ncbi:hypothetical protein MMC10_001839 [Thelotrema lepadinum]|nr:hypothetical protein [Thelotrema lepadinum]